MVHASAHSFKFGGEIRGEMLLIFDIWNIDGKSNGDIYKGSGYTDLCSQVICKCTIISLLQMLREKIQFSTKYHS